MTRIWWMNPDFLDFIREEQPDLQNPRSIAFHSAREESL
jgi:hypothetical protein